MGGHMGVTYVWMMGHGHGHVVYVCLYGMYGCVYDGWADGWADGRADGCIKRDEYEIMALEKFLVYNDEL